MSQEKNDLARHLADNSGNASWLTSALSLSGSELNTLLLEVFRRKARQFSPADVASQFDQNRFSIPSAVDTIAFREMELAWLRAAAQRGFMPLTLSPVTPLGTASVFGTVDQNNVVSALRGTEVVSDATNVLALVIAQQYRDTKSPTLAKYVTTHRHVRGQAFSNPAFTAHFGIFCMVTGGLDTGSFSFELDSLEDHLVTHLMLLSAEFEASRLTTIVYLRDSTDSLSEKVAALIGRCTAFGKIERQPASETDNYYSGIRFKIFLKHGPELINLVDGGTVNWTQKLTANHKHRAMISGSGTELVYKIRTGMI